MATLYLAGFDVFRPDAVAHGEQLKRCCAALGHTGLYPLDNAAPAGLQGPALARWIFEANLRLIRQADAVLANLNPFRGHEPDSGTAFEVGFAHALGKPVWAYVDDARPLVEQVPGRPDGQGGRVDPQGFSIEDFGWPLNLMLAASATVVAGDAQAALRALDAALR